MSDLKDIKDAYSRWRQIAPKGVTDLGSEYEILYVEIRRKMDLLTNEEARRFGDWRQDNFPLPISDSV